MKRISNNGYSKPSKTDSLSCLGEVTIYTFEALRDERGESETEATAFSVLLKRRLFSQHYIEQNLKADIFLDFRHFHQSAIHS